MSSRAKGESPTEARLPSAGDGRASDLSRLSFRLLKRAFDVVASLLALGILVVPGAVLSMVIVIDSPGFPLVAYRRVGRGGRPFMLYKFRSMFADADEHPERYLTEGQLRQWARERRVADDPRCTRVGRAIRALSIDELPQFANVLVGDMSVVGPRPVTHAETLEYGEHRDEVLAVRPGLTGLWQAGEHFEATWENGRRREIELSYVRNASLALDARIVLATLGAMRRADGR